MHTISWNLKALCSGQVTPHTHTPQLHFSWWLEEESTAWEWECILLVWVIWDKVQETLKRRVIKVVLPPKSDTLVDAAELVRAYVFTCVCVRVCVEKIWYLACSSSLQTPAAASGQVCGCPRLPWAQSSKTPSQRCPPHCSHLSVTHSPTRCNICISHLYSYSRLFGLTVSSSVTYTECKRWQNLNSSHFYGKTCVSSL